MRRSSEEWEKKENETCDANQILKKLNDTLLKCSGSSGTSANIDTIRKDSSEHFPYRSLFLYSFINVGNHIIPTRLNVLSSGLLNEPSLPSQRRVNSVYDADEIATFQIVNVTRYQYIWSTKNAPLDDEFRFHKHTRPDQSNEILIVLRFFIQPQSILFDFNFIHFCQIFYLTIDRLLSNK